MSKKELPKFSLYHVGAMPSRDETPESFKLERKSITIGSAPERDLCLVSDEHPTMVEPYHAALAFGRDGSLRLSPSSNCKVFVNGSLITDSFVSLRPDDIITFGWPLDTACQPAVAEFSYQLRSDSDETQQLNPATFTPTQTQAYAFSPQMSQVPLFSPMGSQAVMQFPNCPLTGRPMYDPVMAADGYTYERVEIERYFQTNGLISPMARRPIPHGDLVPMPQARSPYALPPHHSPGLHQHQRSQPVSIPVTQSRSGGSSHRSSKQDSQHSLPATPPYGMDESGGSAEKERPTGEDGEDVIVRRRKSRKSTIHYDSDDSRKSAERVAGAGVGGDEDEIEDDDDAPFKLTAPRNVRRSSTAAKRTTRRVVGSDDEDDDDFEEETTPRKRNTPKRRGTTRKRVSAAVDEDEEDDDFVVDDSDGEGAVDLNTDAEDEVVNIDDEMMDQLLEQGTVGESQDIKVEENEEDEVEVIEKQSRAELQAEFEAKKVGREQAMTKLSALVTELKQTLVSQPIVSENRTNAWKEDFERLEDYLQAPKVYVGVLGVTGAGKSSLLNALLNEDRILPTNAMRACTAAIVELSYNGGGGKYNAEVELLAQEEWETEVQALLEDLHDENGDTLLNSGPNSVAGIAMAKMTAVYGTLTPGDLNMTSLRAKNKITRSLGQVMHLSNTDPKKFREELHKYIDSSNSRGDTSYWPIVKRVRLNGPWHLLQSGVILVDLPGVGDANAARNKIADDYRKQCSGVWIVADINRAIDDRVAKELLGENFRRQLMMDGQYASVAFICTKTDQMQPEEVISNLGVDYIATTCRIDRDTIIRLDDHVADLTAKIGPAKEEKKRAVARFEGMEERLKTKKTEELPQYRSICKRLGILLSGVEDRLKKEEDTLTMEEIEELEAEKTSHQGKLDKANSKLRAIKEYIRSHSEVDLPQARRDKIAAEKRVKELDTPLRRDTAILMGYCAKARNAFSKTRIVQDFHEGIREMHQIENEDVTTAAEIPHVELPVFCISAAEAARLEGKKRYSNLNAVFRRLYDTEIPILRAYVERLCDDRRNHFARCLAQGLSQLVVNVGLYIADDGSMTSQLRPQVRELCNRAHEDLVKSLRECGDELADEISDMFEEQVFKRLSTGAMTASNTCGETVRKWGAKVNVADRSQGGYYYMTYKAVCRRDGHYVSGSAGEVNFNSDLAKPILTAVVVPWDSVLNHGVPDVIRNIGTKIMERLRASTEFIRTELEKLKIATTRAERIEENFLGDLTLKVEEFVHRLLEHVQRQQREVSRLIVPSIQDGMRPAYEGATAERGPGSYTRMRQLMESHVVTHNDIFTDCEDNIKGELEKLCKYLRERFGSFGKKVAKALSTAYEALWEAPLNSRMLRVEVMPKLEDAAKQLTDLCISVGARETPFNMPPMRPIEDYDENEEDLRPLDFEDSEPSESEAEHYNDDDDPETIRRQVEIAAAKAHKRMLRKEQKRAEKRAERARLASEMDGTNDDNGLYPHSGTAPLPKKVKAEPYYDETASVAKVKAEPREEPAVGLLREFTHNIPTTTTTTTATTTTPTKRHVEDHHITPLMPATTTFSSQSPLRKVDSSASTSILTTTTTTTAINSSSSGNDAKRLKPTTLTDGAEEMVMKSIKKEPSNTGALTFDEEIEDNMVYCVWSTEDRKNFFEAIEKFGVQFNSIAVHVGSKTAEMCQQYYERMSGSMEMKEAFKRRSAALRSARKAPSTTPSAPTTTTTSTVVL